MEDLTKQQMILLALLVSFVTSIATGIVTVSLMDQAPKEVTQTINRIVERTVEKVVPSSNNTAAVVTKETVVVKADDLVVDAVEKNKNKIVRLIKIREEYGVKKEKFGGLAIPVSNKNLLVADISTLSKEIDDFGSVIPESYKAVMEDGKTFFVVPVGVDETNSLVFFGARTEDGSLDKNITFSPVILGKSDNLKLGQTVVAIGGSGTDSVSTGIVASLIPSGNGKEHFLIKTDLRFDDAVSGTILLNLSGEVVGILTTKSPNQGFYLPSVLITAGMARVQSSSGNGSSF